jgi:hypothetical protein
VENLVLLEGGRPVYLDDFEVLQSETYYAIFSQFLDLAPCVVHGCAVRALGGGLFEVSAGLVYIEAALYRFDGAASVALPLELHLGTAVETQRAYQSGGSKAVTSERKLEVMANGTAGAKLRVTADGALRFEKAREALMREVGELSFFTILPDQYDANGLGRYGTKAYGWQQLNGKNGAANAAGKSFVGVGASAGNEYAALLGTGGTAKPKIGVNHLPPHAHEINDGGEHVHAIWSRGSEGGDSSTASRGNDSRNDGNLQTQKGGSHGHTMQNTGDGEAFDVRDPWLTVGARVWVGLQ